MKLFGLFGKQDVAEELEKPVPFRLITEFVPYRVNANRRGSSTLMMRVKNMTNEPVLTSVVLEVPKQLSVDSTGITKAKEIRLGTLAPDEEKDAKIDVFSDSATDKGEYTLGITAYIHYRDYGHVLNAMKKRTSLQAV